jgi:epimerase transport system membrane fusion protein
LSTLAQNAESEISSQTQVFLTRKAALDGSVEVLEQRIGQLRNRINEVAPRVRTEAQETAQRVLDEAGDKVRSILERRKNVSTSDIA